MDRRALTWLMIGLGLSSVIALVLYGILTAGGDLIFWLIVAMFILFIGWDTLRHVRSLRSTTPRQLERVR